MFLYAQIIEKRLYLHVAVLKYKWLRYNIAI